MDENKIQNNKIDQDLKTIHTYTSDMADAVRENEASVIKIALAEKEKREREEIYKEASGTNTSKFLLVIGGIILISLSIVGLFFLFKKDIIPNPSVQSIGNNSTLISFDEEARIDTESANTEIDLAKLINLEVDKSGKPGTIKSIFLTKDTNGTQELLGIKDLMSLMNTGAPSALIRTLSDEYMIGTFTDVINPNNTDPSVRPKTHLFLIFKIKDYNQAYAAMLDWEKVMLHDMFTLFNIDVSGNRSDLFEKPWKDIVVDNKDARILYDQDGNDILYYIFVNKDTFIITNSKETIKEIDLRLLAKTTKPL